VLSPRTAKFHVENLIRKLGVEDRRAVAERAARASRPHAVTPSL
jgi:DNA-binding CsgD family transcriptional regulator